MMKGLLKWNPEFAKNVWLEFTPQRLIVMPVIIGLTAALIIMSGSDGARETLHTAAMAGIALLGFLWGIKTSADAILDEYNEKTWDWQKMSIIGPWKLAWGKLFGSTIYNWYGAGICFFIYLLTSFGADDVTKEIQSGVLMLVGMVSVHGLMILVSLQLIRKSDGRTKIKSNRIFISGIILMSFLINIFSSRFLDSFETDITWYGIVRGNMNLMTLNAVFYCAWIIAGLYRAMRAELQFSDPPVWWVSFIGSSFLLHYGYFAGMEKVGIAGGISAAAAITFLEFGILLYFLALSEPKDIVNFRLLESSLKNGDRKTLFENLPLWITTLPFAFMLGFIAVLFFNVEVKGSAIENMYREFRIDGAGRSFAALFAVYGFVLRDLGILLLLNFSNRSKRADSAWIVYLLVLYVLLPMLAHESDLGIGAAFYPDFTVNRAVMVLFPLVEATLVLYFVVKRWREIKVE
jgi:hypothetical protein